MSLPPPPFMHMKRGADGRPVLIRIPHEFHSEGYIAHDCPACRFAHPGWFLEASFKTGDIIEDRARPGLD